MEHVKGDLIIEVEFTYIWTSILDQWHYWVDDTKYHEQWYKVRGRSHWPVQTPSISISGCNNMKNGGPTSISQHNPHQFHGLNLTWSLVRSEHELENGFIFDPIKKKQEDKKDWRFKGHNPWLWAPPLSHEDSEAHLIHVKHLKHRFLLECLQEEGPQILS